MNDFNKPELTKNEKAIAGLEQSVFQLLQFLNITNSLIYTLASASLKPEELARLLSEKAGDEYFDQVNKAFEELSRLEKENNDNKTAQENSPTGV